MIQVTFEDVAFGIAGVLIIFAIIFSQFQKTKTYSRLSQRQLPTSIRNNSSLINSMMVILEIPLVVIFYITPLLVFGYVAIKELILLYTHQAPHVNDTIGSVILLSTLVLLLLYLPYRMFGSTEAKRERFRKGLQWHSDVTNLEEKIGLIKGLLTIDILLIGGFILAFIFNYYNLL